MLPDETVSEDEMKREPPPHTYNFILDGLTGGKGCWLGLSVSSISDYYFQTNKQDLPATPAFPLLSAPVPAGGTGSEWPTAEDGVFQTLCHFEKASHFTMLSPFSCCG